MFMDACRGELSFEPRDNVNVTEFVEKAINGKPHAGSQKR
jgi:hypothetical protein